MKKNSAARYDIIRLAKDCSMGV